MGKLNKFLILAVCVLLNGAVPVQSAWADEYVSGKSGLDVIFVMDYSGSMKSNDPDHMAQGMVKAFVDTVHSADIRIGFVAYNDQLLSAMQPVTVETNEARQELKALIDKAGYSGNTDIGLGLKYAYDLVSREKERKKAIILISDGESDLTGSVTGRVLEDSLEDTEYVALQCGKEGIPVYSIAFGEYDGNTGALEQLSDRTGGQMYPVEDAETLIGILYGIFENNTDFSIEKITDGIYAAGEQNIRIRLDEPYVDELDVLLVSPQTVGPVSVSYGEQQTEATGLKNYAVAKIGNTDSRVKELAVRTETAKNQELQVYLIAYRNLTPVLSVETSVNKNSPLVCQLYFKDTGGNIIADEGFYKNFSWEFTFSGNGEAEMPDGEIRDGIIRGEIIPGHAGTYYLEGRLDDHMGRAVFPPVEIRVINRSPEGGLPDSPGYTVLSGEQRIRLDEYFSDPDGDATEYALDSAGDPSAKAEIQGRELVFRPEKSGTGTIRLLVSDGEDTYEYPYTIEVVPLWKAYWWAEALVAAAVLALVWKLVHKPVPELEKLEAETKKNHFAGKLDAYFTVQPEGDGEIPPLSFQMHRVKGNRTSLGSLLEEYPEACSALELDKVFLVADEDRRMILCHTSNASVMVGSSIICRQIQYSVSFGDVVYITSEDGAYDLEIHYIAVFQ